MAHTGFIGFGSMGSMLVQGFLSTGLLDAQDVIISTRTMEKAAALRKKWPLIEVTDRNRNAAGHCERIFICVRPTEVKPILDEIRTCLRDDAHIISIAARQGLRLMYYYDIVTKL